MCTAWLLVIFRIRYFWYKNNHHCNNEFQGGGQPPISPPSPRISPCNIYTCICTLLRFPSFYVYNLYSVAIYIQPRIFCPLFDYHVIFGDSLLHAGSQLAEHSFYERTLNVQLCFSVSMCHIAVDNGNNDNERNDEERENTQHTTNNRPKVPVDTTALNF